MGTLQVEKPIKVVFEGAKLDVYKKYNNGPKFDLKDIKENFCFSICRSLDAKVNMVMIEKM